MNWKYTSRRWNHVQDPRIYIVLTKSGDYRLHDPFSVEVFATLATAKKYGELARAELRAKQ